MSLVDDAKEGLANVAQGAASILRGEEDVPFESMYKSMNTSGLAEPTREVPRAMFHDPYSVQDWGGWRERPSVLTYESLRQMAAQNTIIAAIIQTRVNQVAAFSRPQQGRYEKGYKIILRDRRDLKRRMSTAEETQATEIERMLETTGFLLPNERPSDRDSFRDFMKKSVRDILIYDQWCWEKIRDRAGRISRFQCLPAHTIRPAVSDSEHMQPEDLRDRVSHVQVYEDTVIAEFSPDDLAWCTANPRSDIRANGFGLSPVEQLTSVITSWLYGFEYNTRFFTQGSAIKGVLNVKGAIPDRQLKAFRRMWYSMVSGVGNAWRTPILNAEDLQWTSMHSNNREMEFGAWMDWLTKITCFPAGTRVQMADGSTQQIEDVKEGDLVLTHKGRARRVRKTSKRAYMGKLIRIQPRGGQEILTTHEHPFLSAERHDRSFSEPKWIPATKLTGSGYLISPSGSSALFADASELDGSRAVSMDEPTEMATEFVGDVYNFSVEEDESYVVEGIAVHNCAVFGIDPVEINFIFGASGVTSSLNDQSPNESQVTESKDKGLRPVMDYIADALNSHLVWEINPDFEFAWVGLDAKAEDDERAAMVQEVQHFRTVNEVRAIYDLDPREDGDVILNQTWLAAQQGQSDAVGGDGPLGEHDDDDDDDDAESYGEDDEGDSDSGEEDVPDDESVEAKGSTDNDDRSGDFGKSLFDDIDTLHKSMTRSVKGGVQTISLNLGEE